MRTLVAFAALASMAACGQVNAGNPPPTPATAEATFDDSSPVPWLYVRNDRAGPVTVTLWQGGPSFTVQCAHGRTVPVGKVPAPPAPPWHMVFRDSAGRVLWDQVVTRSEPGYFAALGSATTRVVQINSLPPSGGPAGICLGA